MENKIKINRNPLILSIVSFTVAYMTATGKILSYIEFADVLNEIAFFGMALTAGVIGLFASFEKSQSK